MGRIELRGAYLREKDLRRADLGGANLSEVDLRGANLSQADLHEANLSEADLRGANLSQADLHGANLSEADLREADLSNARLQMSRLHWVKLDNTTKIDSKWRLVWEIVSQGAAKRNLSGVDLSEANLSGADLSGANLRRADLSKADLRGANLCRADLSGADLNWTSLGMAHLGGARWRAQDYLLLVEDDPDISNMLRIYFTSQGYEVAVAGRGEDAVQICWHWPPNLIILDIMLPDMDGYDVCREVRGRLRTSTIPIIFLTQKDERSDKIHGLELGADDYITKPFDLEELKLRVRNVSSRSRIMGLISPETRLPSSRIIEDQLTKILFDEGWAVLYIGINGFESYRKVYGLVVSEGVLRFAAMVLREAVDSGGTRDDFIGHIGGDDFLIITGKSLVAPIVDELKQRFTADIGTHYDWATRQRGSFLCDTADNEAGCDIMSLSIDVVTDDEGPFSDIHEIGRAARAITW